MSSGANIFDLLDSSDEEEEGFWDVKMKSSTTPATVASTPSVSSTTKKRSLQTPSLDRYESSAVPTPSATKSSSVPSVVSSISSMTVIPSSVPSLSKAPSVPTPSNATSATDTVPSVPVSAAAPSTSPGVSEPHLATQMPFAAMPSGVMPPNAASMSQMIAAAMQAAVSATTATAMLPPTLPAPMVVAFQPTTTSTATPFTTTAAAKEPSSEDTSEKKNTPADTGAADEEEDVQLSEVDWSDKNIELEEMFDYQRQAQVEELPAYSISPLLLIKKLYPYQLQGIRWLIHLEDQAHQLPPWYTKRGGGFLCSITESYKPRQPPKLGGGILGDDMGLGKTLQTLGLILARPPPPLKSYPYVRKRLPRSGGFVPRTTLICAPLSVLAHWQQQIEDFVKKGTLRVHQYHGPNRDKLLQLVKANELDILLVSYHTLAADFKKYRDWHPPGKSSLPPPSKKGRPSIFIFDLHFHRVILDEAHMIRSPKSGFYRSVKKLKTERRLALTGTPYVNRPSDLHSLLSFLQVEPLANARVFKQRVVEPIKECRESGLHVIRTIMAHVCLRRRKHLVRQDLDLVSKKVYKVNVKFIPESPHNIIHHKLYQTCKLCFEGLLHAWGNEILQGANFMRVVSLVLRVRQVCCHADLIPPEVIEVANHVVQRAERGERLSEEDATKLLEQLNGLINDECAVCLEALEPEQVSILSTCHHIFCSSCVHKITNHSCPLCRTPFSPEEIIDKAQAQSAATPRKKGGSCRSPKVQAMLNFMAQMKPDEKGVIFSQWTSFLDIIQAALAENGYTYTRIDGTMNVARRAAAMRKFATERCDTMDHPRFVLCSMHACGTGINLTRGNVVFLMDVWWNVAAENQAMDRVHRIGQTRPVRVYRLLMNDSMEVRLVGLQDAKAAIGKGSLEKLNPEEKRKARLTALKDLFEVEEVNQSWVNC